LRRGWKMNVYGYVSMLTRRTWGASDGDCESSISNDTHVGELLGTVSLEEGVRPRWYCQADTWGECGCVGVGVNV
jgi:hypothetical protein